MKATIERTRAGKWYATIRARNGRILWRTSEDYARRGAVVKAIRAIRMADFVVIEGASAARKAKNHVRS